MNVPKPYLPSRLLACLFASILACTGSFVFIHSGHAAESGDSGHASGDHTGAGAGGHSGSGGSGHEPGADAGSGTHEDGGDHESGGKGKGQHGSGGSAGGHTSGEHPEGDTHEESGDHGQRGPGSGFKGGGDRHVPSGIEGPEASTDSEGRGPRYGGGNKTEPGSQGGAPSWAKEGIPHVELGRLNVARSPESVIQRAYDEVLENWNATLAAFYSQSAADAATSLSTNYTTVVRIDSPLGNLGIYKDLLSDGQTMLPGVTPYSREDMAAIALGSASDKNIPISVDTVKAMNIILGVGTDLTESQLADIAGKADSVRSAIQTGHGE